MNNNNHHKNNAKEAEKLKNKNFNIETQRMWKVKVEAVTAAIRIITKAKEVSGNNTKQAPTHYKKKAILGNTHNKGRAIICNLKPV
jgi:hypothetical protein